jgi:DNA-binding response OmpR family regulator
MANILIVDDDKDILRMLEFALKRAGHEAITTVSGADGLEIIKSTPPHLIIADVMMPGMTGYEFTRQVRQLPDFAELPIVIYSARFQSIDKKTALDAGATEYMPKSTTPSELIKRIDELLIGRTQVGRRCQGIEYSYLEDCRYVGECIPPCADCRKFRYSFSIVAAWKVLHGPLKLLTSEVLQRRRC